MSKRIIKSALVLVMLLSLTPIGACFTSCVWAIKTETLGISDVIDVYTETEREGYLTPNIGKGPHQPADPYQLGEHVTLFALVTHNGYPLSSRIVSWEIYDPQGAIVLLASNMTNATGIANINFRILDIEDAIGEWFIFAKTYVTENPINDTLQFEVYDPPVVQGDINGDGHVDALDLALLGASWRLKLGDPGYNRNADLNGDGYVYVQDLSILGANWGKY